MRSGGIFDGSDKDTRVLTFVQKHPNTTRGAIADAVNLSPWVVADALQRLSAAKKVVITGVRRGQRISAKEGL